jgi:hypothetical protein
MSSFGGSKAAGSRVGDYFQTEIDILTGKKMNRPGKMPERGSSIWKTLITVP